MEYIKIPNIEKYQPSYKDRDIKWIRWDVDAVHDYKISKLTPQQRWVFISLLGIKAKTQEPIPLDDDFLATQCGVSKSCICKEIQVLQKFGLIVTEKEIPCTEESESPSPTYIHTDIHTDTYVGLWNGFAQKKNLPQVKELTSERKAHLIARIKNGLSEDKFVAVLSSADDQEFLFGGDGGWKMTFDWLIRNNLNYTKVLEGSYRKAPKKERPKV